MVGFCRSESIRGFAALNPSDKKMNYNGKEKDVELGAVIWVQFHDIK
jgi:cobalt/nickel transport protein